jgi:ubiquinone/menaquinone biosynthesis C-methylase UbiE
MVTNIQGSTGNTSIIGRNTMGSESYIEAMLVTSPLREPILRQMVKALELPKGSRGLDAGCGIGLQCLLLAKEVGPTGHVIGLDVSAEHLDYGRQTVKRAGLSERISFREGDVTRLPFESNTFDWVWSVDCAGFVPPEPLSSVSELARVTKPGGTVAVGMWSSEKLLPGYPRLEARLGATAAGIAPFVHGQKPEWHFQRALGWLQELGLRECNAETFATSVRPPLSREIRDALVELLRERWPNVAPELAPDDLAEFQRLCSPDSPDFILDLRDYYAFFTCTMFWGKVK